jgi:hypothetical protein
MSQPDNISSMGVRRARQLLQEMIDHPFFIVVFTDDGPKGVAKGLAPDAVAVVGEVVQAVITRD